MIIRVEDLRVGDVVFKIIDATIPDTFQGPQQITYIAERGGHRRFSFGNGKRHEWSKGRRVNAIRWEYE